MKLAGGLKDLKSGLMLNFAGISWLLRNTNLAKNPIVSNGERGRIEREKAANACQLDGAFS